MQNLFALHNASLMKCIELYVKNLIQTKTLENVNIKL